jgi:hypothetical protein
VSAAQEEVGRRGLPTFLGGIDHGDHTLAENELEQHQRGNKPVEGNLGD